MITTRIKALTKLIELEKKLIIIARSPETRINEDISTKYLSLIPEIRREINYYGNIAQIKDVYDKSLGKVNIKQIERFIQDNLKPIIKWDGIS